MKRIQLVTCALVCVVCLAAPVMAAEYDNDTKEMPRYAILAAKIVTCAGDPIDHGVILVSEGKIEAVGAQKDIEIPEGYEVQDYSKMFIMPGLVETHSHLGSEMSDINDGVYPVNPGMRVMDHIRPNNIALQKGIMSGVTTICHIPGSGNNMAGIGVVMKCSPGAPDDVILKFPGVLKMAQAGNPERRSSGELGSGRAGMNWTLRETLRQGQEYAKKWADFNEGRTTEKPEVELRLEYMRAAFEGTITCVIHSQQYQVTMATLMMIHDEFSLKGAVHHGTFDSYRMGEEFAKRDFPAVLGPRNVCVDAISGQVVGVLAGYYERGARYLIPTTDAGVLPEEELNLQAVYGVRYGWPEDSGLMGLTIKAAEYLMIDDRVGSLEVGKDADIVVKNGPVIDPCSAVVKVFIDGKIVYDAAKDRRIF